MRRLSGFLLVLSLIAAACTGAGGGDEGDDDDDDDGGTPPTYWADVAPILNAECTSCHVVGGIGPFELDSYAAAAPLAGSIRAVTESRYMPPSNIDNSGACNTWTDARWLSDTEIATLAAWYEAGAPEGVPPAGPTPTATALPGLTEVDVSVDIGADYTPDTTQPDEYRCFVVDPELTTDQYLVAYDTRPGNAEIVHHVVLFAPTSDQESADAEALDAGDPGAGYVCFGGAQVAADVISVWAPGTGATFLPAGTGLPLPAGRKLVLQVHYNTAAGSGSDRTAIDLDLEATVASEAQIAPFGEANFTLPPGEPATQVTNTTTVPGSATVHSVYPHMHTRGRALRLERTRGGTTECMVDVPRWDFGWQQFFTASTPLDLQAGDEVTITCTYDTQFDGSPVSSGEGTNEEMCGIGLYVTIP